MRLPKFTSFAKSTGFKLTTGQHVACSVAFDGIEPRSLKGDDRELAREILGEVHTIAPDARHVVLFKKGARIGGTRMCATRLLHLAFTVPLKTLAPGERAFGLVVAPDLRLGHQCFTFIKGVVDAVPELSKRVVNITTDTITMKRDDGHPIAIEVVPAAARGSAQRGRTLFGALLTEAAFFRDQDFVINDTEIFRGLVPRIVAGGQIIIESTPWAESGLVYSLFSENHGDPTTCIAMHCPTLLMRPDADTARIVKVERQRDPENAAREFDAEFLAAGTGLFFDANAMRIATDPSLVLPRPRRSGARYVVGADWGFIKDSSAIVVLEDLGGTIRPAYIEEFRPEKGQPLKPTVVAEHFASVARQYGATEIKSDRYYSEAIKEALEPLGVRLSFIRDGSEGKIDAYDFIRSTMNSGRIKLPEHHRLLSQLRAIVSKPTSGGNMTIMSPRRAGHGDIVSALVAAGWGAKLAGRVVEGYRPAVSTCDFDDVDLGGDDAWGRATDNVTSIPRARSIAEQAARQRDQARDTAAPEPNVARQLAHGLAGHPIFGGNRR